MANPNNFPGARTGERLSAKNINRWIAESKDGPPPVRNGRILSEPAFQIPCINTSEDDIPAGAPVSLEEITNQTEDGLLNERCFNVVLLEDATTDQVCAAVAVNFIPAEGAGSCYISGVCLAALTDDNADLIAAAGLTTIWEEDDEGDRWALVRFGGAATTTTAVYILGGQSLGTYNTITSYGILKLSTTLSGITTQVYSPGECNPTTGAETVAPSPAITLWPTGLGFGVALGANGYERVIVINDGRSGPATLLVGTSTSNPTRIPSPLEGLIYSTRTGTVSLLDGSTITGVIPDFG